MLVDSIFILVDDMFRRRVQWDETLDEDAIFSCGDKTSSTPCYASKAA
jgi:hypothetical protein